MGRIARFRERVGARRVACFCSEKHVCDDSRNPITRFPKRKRATPHLLLSAPPRLCGDSYALHTAAHPGASVTRADTMRTPAGNVFAMLSPMCRAICSAVGFTRSNGAVSFRF